MGQVETGSTVAGARRSSSHHPPSQASAPSRSLIQAARQDPPQNPLLSGLERQLAVLNEGQFSESEGRRNASVGKGDSAGENDEEREPGHIEGDNGNHVQKSVALEDHDVEMENIPEDDEGDKEGDIDESAGLLGGNDQEDAAYNAEDEENVPNALIVRKKKSKTQAERQASRGKKSGNQGRFQGESAILMEEFYLEYIKMDRRIGSRGKYKRLEDFWFKVRVAIWENFTWKDFDHKKTGNAQKIVDEVNDGIPGWFQWREAHVGIGGKNPWLPMMNALRKPDCSAPRRTAPYLLYGSKHRAQIAAACLGGNIGQRNRKAKELFEQESVEVRAVFEAESENKYEEERTKYDDAMSGAPSPDPEEQKKARDRLASVMTPLLELIAQYTGFECLTLIGGIAADESWVCNAVNYGQTKEGPPKKFDEFDPAGFRKNFCGQFTKFLKACTVESHNQQAAAVSGNEQMPVPVPSSPPVPAPAPVQQDTPLDISPAAVTPRNDNDRTPELPPPSIPPYSPTPDANLSLPQPVSDDEDDTFLSVFSDAVIRRYNQLSPEGKQVERRRLQGLEEIEIDRENTIATRDELLLKLKLIGPDSILGELAPSDKPKSKPRPKPKQKNPPVNANPERGLRSRRALTGSGSTNSNDSGSPRTDASASTGPKSRPENSTSPSAGSFSSSVVDEDVSVLPFLPPTQQERELTPLDYAASMGSAPEWFASQYRALAKEMMPSEHRELWLAALKTWFDLEQVCKFAETRIGFATAFRPSEIALWIQNARRHTIVPKNRDAYKAQWWKWWANLNPKWRSSADGRPVIGGVGDWSTLFKSGRNGFLMIFASLVGLRHATDEEDWLTALADVQWVLQQVLEAKGRTSNKHQREDEAEEENNVPEEP
ncbi:hypothetical protein EIP86_002392 [Pleurotus ostreatoroseus]|nr:hypothetical protein EIP86_002392 [Pleurotus ostreatoroseus]